MIEMTVDYENQFNIVKKRDGSLKTNKAKKKKKGVWMLHCSRMNQLVELRKFPWVNVTTGQRASVSTEGTHANDKVSTPSQFHLPFDSSTFPLTLPPLVVAPLFNPPFHWPALGSLLHCGHALGVSPFIMPLSTPLTNTLL